MASATFEIKSATQDAQRDIERFSAAIDDLANTKAAQAGFDDLQKKLEAFSRAANKDAAGALSTFGVNLNALNSPLTLVAQTIKDSLDFTTQYASEVRKLSYEFGIGAEESSKMLNVFEDMEVSTGAMNMAFKTMVKAGLQPSIENLAKLSDEYLAIQDPVARSQFAVEKFGRAGLEMSQLLSQGSTAIRQMSADVETSGKVMTDEGVAAAKEYALAVDDLNDILDGLKLELATGLIPTLTKAATAMKTLLTWDKQLAMGVRDNAKAIALSDVTQAEYEAQLRATAKAAGLLIDAHGNLYKQYNAGGPKTILQEHVLLTEAERKEVIATDEARRAQEEQNQALGDLQYSMQGTSQAIQDNMMALYMHVDATEIDKQKIIDNRIQQEIYAAQVAEAGRALTVAMGGALLQNSRDVGANAYEHEMATKRILFGYLQQRVAVDDLTTDEQDMLMGVARAWGLVSQADVDAYNAMIDAAAKYAASGDRNALYDDLQTAYNAANDLHAAIDGIPRYVQVVIETLTSGQAPLAYSTPGGEAAPGTTPVTQYGTSANPAAPAATPANQPIVLPHGTRAGGGPVFAGGAYMVGERGPELFVPRQSGNVVSNYNLTINTHMAPSIPAEFGRARALAGAL